ncbi:methyl-accepting chemotaxis protein [Marinomonas sp. 2405UD66-6]|uniref:methyl-accepting chemotaxis protein n=1 Tax=Marinomonas sp. 2405UD66-6 TaxID=3391834 RepID=UPI0039C8C694
MNISIKMRLILLGTVLAFIPALIISLLIKNAAIKDASTIIEADARNKLVALRDVTSVNIQDYLNFINDQLITYSSNLMIIEAMKSFAPAFHEYVNQTPDSELANTKQELLGFYRNQFDKQYQSLNGGQTSSPDNLYQEAGKSAWVMQSLYISGNQNPLGEKHKLIDTKLDNDYSRLHAKFHPSITQYQQLFGYYDIFLVDAETGHIVYSVFKELDFATSLKNGPYANSGIGEAYKKALTATDKDQTFLTDFAPYQPSYNGSASFISSPIFDGGKKIGVMIFQMPVDKINNVMNHHNDWLNSGLGETGETYLVGSDKTMRSNARGLIEDKQEYLDMLTKSGVSAQKIQTLDTKDNTIGLLTVDTQGVQNALGGKSGVASYNNAHNHMVLSAYKPLKILGLDWAIMSEITQEEAFREVKLLEKRLSSQILYFVAGFLVLGGLLGWGLAYIITRPINQVITTVHGIGEGEGDLTQRLDVKGKDETAALANGINTFIGNIDETFSAILNSVVRLIPISQDIANVNEKISKASQEQKSFSDEINKQLNETNEAAKLVNDKLEQIHGAATSGNQVVDNSSSAVEDINKTMKALSNNISEAVAAINTLTQDTDRISGIIDVINGIAEQTNLLALNAAIEAARAGEAGRGFAVVADEVRTLASKTRQSTDEVTDMVNSIQSSTRSVVSLMDNSQKNAASSSDNVAQATQELDHVKKAMTAISERVHDISEAINAQQSSFMEINNTYEVMGESFQKAQLSTEESMLVGKDITKLGDTIMQKISKFKVTDQTWSTSRRNQIRNDETD